jgi:hypothetical protein
VDEFVAPWYKEIHLNSSQTPASGCFMRIMVSDRQSLTGKIFGGFKVGSKLKGDRHVIEPLNRDRCESPP